MREMRALTFTACKKNVGTPEDNAASKDENTEEKDKDEQESWKIGFSGIDMENPYFLTLESAIKEEVDGKNCELIVKDPKTDPDMQASQIQEMIDEGININTVRKIIGHENERTTYNNYCYDRKRPEEIVSQLDRALDKNYNRKNVIDFPNGREKITEVTRGNQKWANFR